MEYRRLGQSGLKVSEIGLGCNNFGSRLDQAGATRVVQAALEAGVNLFDTADYYSNGRSETLLGVALGARRDEALIATKFGLPMGVRADQRGASRRYIMDAVDASLKRLGVDHIDLYQVHVPDPDTPIEETLRALDDLVRAGKIRYLGNSNFPAWRIADADWTARAGQLNRFISAQNNFSLIERSAEAEVLPACERFGIGFLPYFPLSAGLLSGKYRRGEPPPEGTRIALYGEQGKSFLSERNFDRVETLSAYASERGHSLLELAFAWLLGKPVVSSVIAGAMRPEQLAANVAAAGWRLSPAEVEEVSKLTA